MNLDWKAHVGHRVVFEEAVEQRWELRWQVTDATERGWYLERVLEPGYSPHTEAVLPGHEKLYCASCDLYLTDFQELDI